MSRSDLEKKKLYDLMQFMAFHSRERLVKIFRDCYDDHRDIKQVLDMITTRAGYVKLIGQTFWGTTGQFRHGPQVTESLIN